MCVLVLFMGNWVLEFCKWFGEERCDLKVVEGGDKEARKSFEEFVFLL